MCGILGYLGTIDKEEFKQALNQHSHRGPDYQGTWYSNEISLGHNRLSIIDLSSSANQPMEALDRYIITFNGEIYNYKELQEELVKHGFQFKTDSDTEVLLYAFAQWGPECLKKFNGMWAFAIWDKQEKQLFLSRDRNGKKPLFYYLSNDKFIFSSEMKGIYPFIAPIEIDYENLAFARENVFVYESTDRCLIKHIKRFPAGHYAWFKNGSISFHQYWNIFDELIEVPKSYEEQQEQFRELFTDACRLRMRSDVPVSTALSGGLDSSAVFSTLFHLNKGHHSSGDNLHRPFVATFPGTSLDETEYARSVADFLGTEAEFLPIDPLKDLDQIFFYAYQFEELFYGPTIPFVQLYKHIKDHGIKVSIDGHGADELFAGYQFDFPSALMDTLPNLLKFNEIFRTLTDSNYASSKDYYNYLKYALANKYKLLRRFTSEFTEQNKYDRFDYLTSRLHDATYKSILPTLLRNYDRYSMMNGVEIRMPFLDYRIQQLAFSIPFSSKIRNGFSKAIVRDSLKDILPPKIYHRKSKIGFNSPMNSWMKNELKTWILDQINSTSFQNSVTIDPKKSKQQIVDVLKKKNPTYSEAEQAFTRLMPYIWETSLNFAGKV